MLLARTEEIRIIISHLETKKNELVNTLGKMRVWANMANVKLSENQMYIYTKADLFTIGKRIDEYKNLL